MVKPPPDYRSQRDIDRSVDKAIIADIADGDRTLNAILKEAKRQVDEEKSQEISSSADILPEDIQKELAPLSSVMMANKVQEQTILAQSIAEGGPASTHDALLFLLDQAKIGIRELSAKVGLKRTELKKMVEGEKEMPHDVFSGIYEAIRSKRPDLLAID